MAEYSKPSDLNVRWASSATGGDITDPGDNKVNTGNVVEKPAYNYFNWWMNRVDTFNAFMNQHGYPTWDADTEYQAEKSYVMHSNGTIYRCIQTHTNQAIPNATYWEIAFGDYGTSYTKAESDGKYLQISLNGGDISNIGTFRTNLSVYSIAQVNDLTAQATETVRGTAEVATAAEARAFSSDTVMITPNKLSEAFKGSNQSLAASGYQKLPGGLILQWASETPGSKGNNATGTITFPLPFPTACLQVILGSTESTDTAGSGSSEGLAVTATTLSTFSYRSSWNGANYGSTNALRYLAIGY